MARVTSQKTRQMILVAGDPLDLEGPLPDKLQLFDEEGMAQMFGGGYNRQEFVYTTPSLTPGQVHMDNPVLASGLRILRVESSDPCRIRVYATQAQQLADENRQLGIRPRGNHGRLFELVTTPENLLYKITPEVDIATDDDSGLFWLTVTNLTEETTVIEVTFYYVRTE